MIRVPGVAADPSATRLHGMIHVPGRGAAATRPRNNPFSSSFFLRRYLALATANNVENDASETTRERVIGVRGVSLWQAMLEHPARGGRAEISGPGVATSFERMTTRRKDDRKFWRRCVLREDDHSPQR